MINVDAVFSDPRDLYWPIAERLAYKLSIPLVSVLEAKETTSYRSAYLFCSPKSLEQEIVQRMNRRGLALGILSAPNIDVARQVADRFGSEKPGARQSPWVAGNTNVLPQIVREDVQLIDTSVVDCDDFLSFMSSRASFGLIIGHGREDVCYFDNLAICGQARELPCDSCSPTNCAIQKPKVPADALSARVLFVLSCYAGKIGDGLFPPECRLSQSMLQGGASSVIAPAGIVTMTSELVSFVLESLENGLGPWELARVVEEYQQASIGETIELNVFGNPGTTSYPRPSLDGVFKKAQFHPLIDEVARINEGAKALEALELLEGRSSDLSNALENSANKLSRLSRYSISNPETNSRLKKIVGSFVGLSQEIEEDIIDLLVKRSTSGYFWVAECYDWFVRHQSLVTDCIKCGSTAKSETFTHPWHRQQSRIRVTCSRCGVVEDRSSAGPRMRIAQHSCIRNQIVTSVELKLLETDGIGALVGASINNAREMLNHAEIVFPSGHVERLPCRLQEPGPYTVKLSLLAEIPDGVHVAKIFASKSMHLTEASTPIPLLRHVPSQRAVEDGSISVFLCSDYSQIERCEPLLAQLLDEKTIPDFRGRTSLQFEEGYRLAGLEDRGVLKAVGGFRLMETISWGRILFVDDLVTDAGMRSKGYGEALLKWICDYAERHGCNELHLDSGLQRTRAHEFYERFGMQKNCYHFTLKLADRQ